MANQLPSKKSPFFKLFVVWLVVLAIGLGAVYLGLKHLGKTVDTSSKPRRPSGGVQTAQALASLESEKTTWLSHSPLTGYKVALPADYQAITPSPGADATYSRQIGNFNTIVRVSSLPESVGKKPFSMWVERLRLDRLQKVMTPLIKGAQQVHPDMMQRTVLSYEKEEGELQPRNCSATPMLMSNKVVYVEVCSDLNVPFASTLLRAIEIRSIINAPSKYIFDSGLEQKLQAAAAEELVGLTDTKTKKVLARQKTWENRRGLECLLLPSAAETEECFRSETEARILAIGNGEDLKEPAFMNDNDESETIEEVEPTDEIKGTGAAVNVEAFPLIRDTKEDNLKDAFKEVPPKAESTVR